MQKEISFITQPIKNSKGYNQFVKVLAIQEKTWDYRIYNSLSDCSKELKVALKEVSGISLKGSYTCAKGWTFVRLKENTIIQEEIKYFQAKRRDLNVTVLPATRKCSCCKKELPLTESFFHKGRSASKYAKLIFKSICKECRKGDHRKHYETRKEKILHDELLRAESILAIYKKIDKAKGRDFNLSLDWVQSEIIGAKCFYCEDDISVGIERKDNSIGHIQSNCVPCCKVCNIARMNNFTHEEFIKIGSVIKVIKSERNGTNSE